MCALEIALHSAVKALSKYGRSECADDLRTQRAILRCCCMFLKVTSTGTSTKVVDVPVDVPVDVTFVCALQYIIALHCMRAHTYAQVHVN